MTAFEWSSEEVQSHEPGSAVEVSLVEFASEVVAQVNPVEQQSVVQQPVAHRPPLPTPEKPAPAPPAVERLQPVPDEVAVQEPACEPQQSLANVEDFSLESRLTTMMRVDEVPEPARVQAVSYAAEGSRAEQPPPGPPAVASARDIETWVDARPRYRSNPLPEYPYQARARQWHGEVWLLVDVDAAGKVVDLEIDRTSGYAALDRSAKRAVRRWEFMPALSAGLPVASRVRVPVRFELDEG